jgi:hypothetical protein
MEELHTDSIDGGHEGQLWARSRARERAYSNIYDSIMIITDRLTKYTYFIPYLKSSSAEDLAYIFHKYVMTNHGFP